MPHEARHEVLQVAALLSGWIPWVSELTAELWATRLLDEASREVVEEAIEEAAATFRKHEICLAVFRAALDRVRRPKAQDDSRALPAFASGPPTREQKARIAMHVAGILRDLGPKPAKRPRSPIRSVDDLRRAVEATGATQLCGIEDPGFEDQETGETSGKVGGS